MHGTSHMFDDRGMLYQHPLAYLVGLHGVALLRAWGGGHDREFVAARLDEIRTLLDDDRWGDGATAEALPISDLYDGWSAWYDEPGNRMLDIEQPYVREILDRTEPGVALDAACGTGRHAAYLAERGHRVIGVDGSPGMLAKAREKIPDGEFSLGELERLPVPDDQADLAVCALALCHVPDLAPVFREFARVLKPGGRLVVSDTRGLLDGFDHPLIHRTSDGEVGYLPNRHRSAADYLTAAIAAGFEVLSCVEPRQPSPYVDENGFPPGADSPVPESIPNMMPNVWGLHPFAVAATNAAFRDVPILIVWEFRLRKPSRPAA